MMSNTIDAELSEATQSLSLNADAHAQEEQHTQEQNEKRHQQHDDEKYAFAQQEQYTQEKNRNFEQQQDEVNHHEEEQQEQQNETIKDEEEEEEEDHTTWSAQVVKETLSTSLSTHVEPLRLALNPDDLARGHSHAGDYWHVTNTSRQLTALARAWPTRKLNIGQVQLSDALQSALDQPRHVMLSPALPSAQQHATGGTTVVDIPIAQSVSVSMDGGGLNSNTNNSSTDIGGAGTRAYVLHCLTGRLVQAGTRVSLPLRGRRCTWKVEKMEPINGSILPAYARVNHSTEIVIVSPGSGDLTIKTEGLKEERKKYSESDNAVGGLADQVKSLRQVLDLALVEPESLRAWGVRPPRGVLLHGPPGTGKTRVAQHVAALYDAELIVVNGPEVLSRFVGDAEAQLEAVFARAKRASPAIIFIDEVDALCPARTGATDESHKRVVATLLTLMDGLDAVTDRTSNSNPNITACLNGTSRNPNDPTSPCCVAVIAATNRPDDLDEALRRPGRLDREVEVGVPTAAGRVEILELHLAKLEHCVTHEQLNELGDSCHGFVGADLMSLCEKAAWLALRRALAWREGEDTPRRPSLSKGEENEQQQQQQWQESNGVTDESEQLPQVTYADMINARARTTPSALRQVVVDVAKVAWADVGGQENVKQQLKEAVEWPLKHPEAFKRMGVSPPQGVLLYGPPGCSKTLLAKAIATQGQMNFIAVKGPELFSKWVGDSEKQVMQIFRKARASAPTVIFFDEIDALASSRGGDGGSGGVGDRVLSQMLVELDGMHSRKGVVVVAATNRPDIVDAALLRPGRLDRGIHTRKVPLGNDVDMQMLAERTSGFSGAELRSVCREGALAALREDMSALVVKQRHFMDAIEQTTPQITTAMLEFYKGFADSRRSK